jgi:hypothetical protein
LATHRTGHGAPGQEQPGGSLEGREDAARIEELREEARYRRERYDLYRAKMYGLRRTSMTRLGELERASQGAEARLRRAEQERRAHERD